MVTLTDEIIQQNRIEFINLVTQIKRDGARIEELIEYLDSTDFFSAPASTQFHMSCDGGLCQHSLNVYNNLVQLYTTVFNIETLTEEQRTSLIIVALLHDISKVNLYEKTFRNEKVYSDSGSKSDNGGRFDWVSVPGFKKCSAEKRFIFGNHEQNSEYIARCFIPLMVEESVAILHHMGGMAWDSAKDNIGEVYNQYSLALLLYMSDMLSTYISEK